MAALFLVIWCALHSALISNSILEWIRRKTGRYYRFYRLFFNLFALATFLPILYYFEFLHSNPVFRWYGYFKIAQLLIVALCFYLFIAGGLLYDALHFLGLRQISSRSNHKTLTKSGHLNTLGLLSIVRHPWYSGSILIIWARNLDTSAIVQNIILTLYLIIGTYLEEQKLVTEFGQEYRDYQKNVSMLVPVKWMKSKLRI